MSNRCGDIKTVWQFNIYSNICVCIQISSEVTLISGVIDDMVVQMFLCFHRIHTKLALNGRIGEDVCAVTFVKHIIGDMLNNGSSFLVID